MFFSKFVLISHCNYKVITLIMTNSSTKQQIEQNKILKTIKEYAIMTVASVLGVYGKGFQPIKL